MKIITRKEAIEQGLKRYYTGKPCKNGHVAERKTSSYACCECLLLSAGRIKKYMKKRRNENKRVRVSIGKYAGLSYQFSSKYGFKCFDSREGSDIYRFNPCKSCGGFIRLTSTRKCAACTRKRDFGFVTMPSKDRDSEISKISIMKNKESYNKRKTAWRLKNKDSIVCRNLMSRLIKDWNGEREVAEIALGWVWDDFVSSMEAKFKPGMKWDNHGRKGWHIDHIKPVKAFLDEGITDPAIINALDNLQPLWAHENLSKGARY